MICAKRACFCSTRSKLKQPRTWLSTPTPWNLDLRAALSSAEEPANAIDAGSLEDDLHEVTNLLARSADDVVVWHDVSHVCGLLRYLAYRDLP
jgi:hypothetical protein